MCILLIEDDTVHMKLIKRALQKGGYGDNILCFEDGEKALSFLFPQDIKKRTICPRLILLDINIPKINGIEVLKKIKTDERLKIIPVVILTTSKNRSDKEKCYKFCANSYVSKPLNFNDFMIKINSIAHYWLKVNDIIDD